MRFHPLKFGWLAVPPQPKAVVVFIGGAFFGTFPTVFYRGFLNVLHGLGYAVVALPFRFTFNHWDIALSLSIALPEIQKEVEASMARLEEQGGNNAGVARSKLPYLWVAHSLGCKYVALLELLSETEDFSKLKDFSAALQEVEPSQAQDLLAKLSLIEAQQLSLRNQPQLLVDPVIANLDAAIPWKPLEGLLASLLRVIPSREVTYSLIEKSKLFSFTRLFSLASKTACDTINRLTHLQRIPPLQPLSAMDVELSDPKPLLGRHLAILGLKTTDAGLARAISKDIAAAYAVAVHYQIEGGHGSALSQLSVSSHSALSQSEI